MAGFLAILLILFELRSRMFYLNFVVDFYHFSVVQTHKNEYEQNEGS